MRSGQGLRHRGKGETMNLSNAAKGVAIAALLGSAPLPAGAMEIVGGSSSCRLRRQWPRPGGRHRPGAAWRSLCGPPRWSSCLPPRLSAGLSRLCRPSRLSPGLPRLSPRLCGLGPSGLVSLGARRRHCGGRGDRLRRGGGSRRMGAGASGARPLLVLHRSKPAARFLGRLPVRPRVRPTEHAPIRARRSNGGPF